MRIVLFVGSPIEAEEKELTKLAKRLKKEKVNVDIVSFGEEVTGSSTVVEKAINNDVLATFISTLNGKDGAGSHLVTVPPGPHLSDALISSPVIQGEDGMGGAGLGTAGFEFGVDPNEDPELALALRVSMEEQRQRQEQEARRANPTEKDSARPETIKEAPSEEVLLERALAMSMEGQEETGPTVTASAAAAASAAQPDFAHMTEDEQIAFAMQMSMQDSQEAASGSTTKDGSSKKEEKKKEEKEATPMEVEDYREVMNDPAFLQSVLENLPGVDPQSEAVRQAVTSLSKDQKDKDKKQPAKDQDKK